MDNPEIKILTTRDSKEWSSLLSQMPISDIYYLPHYVNLFEEHQNEEVNMFCYISRKNIIIYPFFIRPIYEYPECEGYFDISSTWYYGGPLIKNFEIKSINDFYVRFHKYCEENKIVSEFARMHPLIKNYEWVDDKSLITKKWDTVYIDLEKDKKQIIADFNKTCRNYINKANRLGVVVERSNSQNNIEAFYNLYTESMRRKAANQFYFFSMNFINRLLNEFGEKAQLFLTKLDDNVISADLILHNNYFSSSYLRAFNPKYKNINPNNLLISEQIMWSKSIGCRYFLLHGGQLEGDSLFKFKKSFSKIVAPFYTYQKIHNDEIYNLLAKAHNIIQPSTASDYFPIYRSPRNVIIYKTAVINVPENDKFIHPEAGHIGDFVLIAQSKFTMSKGAQINSGAKIVGNGDFHMGAYSTVSYNVVILTSSDFGKVMNDYAKPEERLVVRGSVSLGDRVFVGAGATISVTPKEPHIMIGDDTIIMANSYVDRSLPAAIKYGKWEPKNEIIITRAHDLG